MMLRFRGLVPDDQAQLWHWLHISLWDPPPAPLRPITVLKEPRVRIYAENWGNPGDVGVVARLRELDIGACWMRCLAAGVGLASIDEVTPQLGIALLPEFQHKGHGRPLLLAGLQAAHDAGYAQVSLTVHPENPAIRTYLHCGFEKRAIRSSYHLMVATLRPAC